MGLSYEYEKPARQRRVKAKAVETNLPQKQPEDKLLAEPVEVYGGMKAVKIDISEIESKLEQTAEDSREAKLAEQLITAVESPDVKVLCERYHLRREELGRLTGFSLRALADWAAGKLPSQPAARRLHEVRRLLDGLSHWVPVEAIPQWLHQPNAAFDHLTPLQVIEIGEIDRLWSMVHERAHGVAQ